MHDFGILRLLAYFSWLMEEDKLMLAKLKIPNYWGVGLPNVFCHSAY